MPLFFLGQGLPFDLLSADLSLDDLFPKDRLVELRIDVAEEDWDTLRHQTRNFRTALGAARQFAPPPSPYTYVDAQVILDGVVLPKVGLRKKGFLGSQDHRRPSLKIKLNHHDETLHIDGLTSLTFNNNKQERSLMSQFMGYAFFNAAGSPAPRCAFAKVIVNGQNLGVYSHVETVRQPLLAREFGTSEGVLYEGTVVDFFPDWEDSFELKVGDDEKGKDYIRRLTEVLNGMKGTSLLGSEVRGKAWVPNNETMDRSWFLPEFDDHSWKSFRKSVGYERGKGYEKLIGKNGDFEREMHGKTKTIYLRIPFHLEDPGLFESQIVLLRMKCDDGFVAYLNGTEIARHNAPKELDWKSAATESTDDSVAGSWFDFDLAESRYLLQKGNNLLAIQGLNITENSTDFLVQPDIQYGDFDLTKEIWELVNEEAFYTFWTVEGLLSFWDGYSGNRNNFFVYINPQTDRCHFMPWGADCLYQKYSPLGVPRQSPRSVRTVGLLAHKLYQIPSVRKKYATKMKQLLDELWIESDLLEETKRIEKMLKPHLSASQKEQIDFDDIRDFIRKRRPDIEKEIQADDMPFWNHPPSYPFTL